MSGQDYSGSRDRYEARAPEEMQRTIDGLRKELEEALAIIDSVEFYQPGCNSAPSCPWCGMHLHEGHDKDCQLSAILTADEKGGGE